MAQQARSRMRLEYSVPQRAGDQWQVIVTAILSLGQDVLAGEEVQFYVNGVIDGGPEVADGNGRVQRQIIFPVGQRGISVSVQQVGGVLMASTQINVPQEVPPQIALEVATPLRVGDHWEAVAVATVTRDQRPIAGVAVQFSVNLAAQGMALQTDNSGRVQQVLNFSGMGGAINTTAEAVGSAARVNIVVQIPMATKKAPHKVEIKVDGSRGLYTIHVIVVDAEGRGVESDLEFCGLLGSVDPTNNLDVDYPDFVERKTSEKGFYSFPIKFEFKEMDVRVIVLGTAIDQKVVLAGPKNQRMPNLTLDEENLSVWEKMKLAWKKAGEKKQELKNKKGVR